MRNFRKFKRPSHTTVVAYLSLFLVISGGAAYAATKIGPRQLKANAVTAAKIKAGAVTPTKLRDGAVSSVKLRDGAVSSAKLGGGAVTQAKIAAGAVGGNQADEASFQGLIKGSGTQSSHSFSAPAGGFLPQPLVLAVLPGFGQIEFLFCGGFDQEQSDQMRVRMLSADPSPPFFAVNRVEASNLQVGGKHPVFTEFGAGQFGNGGGEPLLAELPDVAEKPGPFGIAAKWDFQLFRDDSPDGSSAHIVVSALNDSTVTNKLGRCHVTAEAVIQP